VAKAARRPLKQDFKKDLWPALRRLIWTRAVAAYLLFGFTAEYVVRGLAYLSWRSLVFDPNGILIWTFFGAMSLAYSLIFARTFFKMYEISALQRQARKRYDNYEAGAEEELRAAIMCKRMNLSMGPMLLAVVLMMCSMVPPFAYSFWRDIQTPLVQSPKHPHPYSPRKELQKVLTSMERRGIFTNPNPDQ
jgi:hypothetical protein